MTNIFVEGIQGMGKSTLINGISKLLPKLHVCREGDYSPVDLAWCAWMSEVDYKAILLKYPEVESEILKNTMKEQEYYIVTYTKIKTEVLGFYKDLECYEIYNGRKSLSELKEIIFNRFRNFTETGYLFECAFFQNIVEDMILFHVLSDEEIIEFYRELFLLLDRKNFLLLYLYSDRLEENLQIIQRERCDEEGNEVWYQLMLDYIIKSPYGKKHGYSGEKDLINHLKHRQELELSIIKEVLGEHALILPAKEYDLEKIIAKITFSEKISYTIRKITSDEYEVLDDFLYEAIFIHNTFYKFVLKHIEIFKHKLYLCKNDIIQYFFTDIVSRTATCIALVVGANEMILLAVKPFTSAVIQFCAAIGTFKDT